MRNAQMRNAPSILYSSLYIFMNYFNIYFNLFYFILFLFYFILFCFVLFCFIQSVTNVTTILYLYIYNCLKKNKMLGLLLQYTNSTVEF